jgi:hypothetical protein
MKGNRSEAIANLKKALENNPGDPWALSHLGVLTGDSLYIKRIVRYFEQIDAEYFMAWHTSPIVNLKMRPTASPASLKKCLNIVMDSSTLSLLTRLCFSRVTLLGGVTMHSMRSAVG